MFVYEIHGGIFHGKEVGQTSRTFGPQNSEKSFYVWLWHLNFSDRPFGSNFLFLFLFFLAHGEGDGVFWIGFEDMLRYFDCIDVCKVRKGWSEVRVSGVLPPMSAKSHQSCTLLTVLEPTEVEFVLFQEGQRNSEKSQRSQLDLCVVVFRTSCEGQPQLGRVLEHSKRQVRGFVGCHAMLERGCYLVVCLAFNHWHTSVMPTLQYPGYVLTLHSSKRLLVEQLNSSYHLLADAIINLTLAKGKINYFL